MAENDQVRQKTSRGWRARVLVALGFGFFIDSAEDVALPMLWPAVRTALGLSYAQLSYIDSIRVIFQTFSGPFWGMLADRYNRKWILVIGTGMWGLWTSVCGLTTNYWQLLLVRVIACIGLGCLYPAAFSMLADSFGPKQRGRAMGTISAIGMFGIVAGALAFGEVIGISANGWRIGFIGLGLTSALSGLVIAVLVKEPVRGASEPELESVITKESSARFRFRLADVKEILKVKTVQVNFLQGIFMLTTINALATFYVTWLVDDRGFSEADAPMFFGGVVIALALGNLAGGMVGDWAYNRWPKYGRAAVSQISIAIALPAMWYLFTRATTAPAIVICSVIAGFFLDWTRRGAMQPMVQSAVRPELRSTAMALTEFVNGAFASVVIILFGKYADQFGLSRTLLVLTCGFWAVAFLVTPLYYLVFPKDSKRLHDQMQERRGLITGQGGPSQ
ncbi:MAG: MFS transporter [Chloroflexi bacterium]|nr:MFS transporter [Chloroflexota bacterium]